MATHPSSSGQTAFAIVMRLRREADERIASGASERRYSDPDAPPPTNAYRFRPSGERDDHARRWNAMMEASFRWRPATMPVERPQRPATAWKPQRRHLIPPGEDSFRTEPPALPPLPGAVASMRAARDGYAEPGDSDVF
jgi:hypothetical protein